MDEKRMRILESAMKFFSEKGYFYTSMQDIASDCGISKGYLYKVFDSKEDLLIQLFEYNYEKMFQKGKAAHLDGSLPDKEKLEKLVAIELEGVFENRDFFNIIYKSLPGDDNHKILALMKRTRAAMIDWHRSTLLRIYGERVERQIWDLAITFQGIIKEFIFLVSREGKQVDFDKAAAYIAALLDTVINNMPEWQEVLDDHLMSEYRSVWTEDAQWTEQEKRTAAFTVLKTAIGENGFEQQLEKELFDTVDLLEEELQKQEPRRFLISALLSYLKKEDKIKNQAEQVEAFLY